VNDSVVCRPVDVAFGPEGAVYVSDDYAGAVYRVAAGRASAAGRRAPALQAAPGGDPLASLPVAQRGAARVRGAALYEAHACFGCHEPERAERGVVPKPLAGLRSRYDLPGLAAFLLAPTPPMPAFPLAAAERSDLAVYLLEARP
jgi:cytochrome c553